MSLVVLYIASVVLFLALDFVGLSYLVKPVFDRQIGEIMLERPRYGPALVFYLFYVVGLMVFVTAPALRDGTPLMTVFLLACLFGAVAYGTYEFSNLATLKGWTWSMVAVDLTWGTVLTGTTAAGGLAIARALS